MKSAPSTTITSATLWPVVATCTAVAGTLSAAAMSAPHVSDSGVVSGTTIAVVAWPETSRRCRR